MVYSSENFYKIFDLVRKRIPYKICIKSINPEEILLRSDIKDFDGAAAFIDAYEAVTRSHFKVLKKKNESSFVHRRKWTCTHNIVIGNAEKCLANISILIKKNNKQNRLKDAFLRRIPPHLAVIKVNPNHNHPLMTPFPPYRMLKINNGVKECFYEYFKRGYFGDRAKWLHEQNLRKAHFYALEDESMNPNLQAIYTLFNNWSKMKENVQFIKASENGSSESFVQTSVKRKENEISHSSQNLENFIDINDVVSRIKKEPVDECVITENITNETMEDIKPVLNIKQEITDDDNDDGLPVISSYGSVVAPPPPVLPSPPVVTTTDTPRTSNLHIQNVAAVVKTLQPSPSQIVMYDKSSNTYKVVKYVSVNSSAYSSNQYKSYLPSNLLPSRISLSKF